MIISTQSGVMTGGGACAARNATVQQPTNGPRWHRCSTGAVTRAQMPWLVNTSALGPANSNLSSESAPCFRPTWCFPIDFWSCGALVDPFVEKEKSALCRCLIASFLSRVGCVYVVGGFDGERCLDSAEEYSAESDQWTQLRRMTNPRSGVSLITYQDYIYALGGFDGENRLRSGNVMHLLSLYFMYFTLQ